MTEKFQLPGAKGFASFIESRADGVLTAEGPEIVDRIYGGTRKWVVKLDGERLGEYLAFGSKPGETEFSREFRGRVPGYVNELVLSGNEHKLEDERVPIDTVCLTYSNRAYEEQDADEGEGRLVDTPWQRQDGHDEIPFP